jgi:hypothetical protein
MNLQLTVLQQEALMYAISVTLLNKQKLRTSDKTLLELEDLYEKLAQGDNVKLFI